MKKSRIELDIIHILNAYNISYRIKKKLPVMMKFKLTNSHNFSERCFCVFVISCYQEHTFWREIDIVKLEPFQKTFYSITNKMITFIFFYY